jgi:DeoR family transcriptional regulator, catabolite repression regulator
MVVSKKRMIGGPMNRNLTTPKVGEIMSQQVIVMNTNSTVFDAVKTFNANRISAAPVLNDQHQVVGFLSESDCIQDMANRLFYDENKPSTIDRLMSTEVEFANVDWDIYKLEDFFLIKRLKCAPVTDSAGNLVGMVTRRDILKRLEDLMKGRDDYKGEIKRPFELNTQERIKILLNR